MARMHTKKHGKSKSRKPDVKLGEMPEGLTLTKEQITQLIVDYAGQGMSQAQIGQTLMEKHNVPYVKQVFEKRLGAVMKENKVSEDLPQDLVDLMRKAINLRKHIVKNHNDQHNKTSLIRTESKIWRLSRYYKRTKVLPVDWKYEPEKIALIIKAK